VPERPPAAPSSPFDRVGKPDPTTPRRRDGRGKEALYSTAPTAAPTAQVEVYCRSCDVLTGVSLLGALKLLKPPMFWDPIRGLIWSRCPTCQRRAWLVVKTGQALRVLLDRSPTR
jgi:hypothetical protein